jgi:hypothetical protein
MGLQNKGCRHSDVHKKKKEPKQTFFSRTEKKVKNITPTGSPLGHPVEGHS